MKWKLPIPAVGVVVGADAIYAAGGAPDGTATLYAVAFEGAIKWTFVADLQGFASTPAIGFDGTVYLPVGGKDPTEALYAVAPDGTLKWARKSPGFGRYTTPALGPDGSVYYATTGALHAVTPEGVLLWQIAGKPLPPSPCSPMGCPFPPGPASFSSPAVGADGSLYAESERGEIYALHPDGTEAWTLQLPTTTDLVFPHVTAGSDGTIFAGSNHFSQGAFLQAIHPDGSQAWSFSPKCCGSLPQAAIAADGTAYFGLPMAVGQTVFAVDAAGALKWTIPTGGTAPDSIAVGGDGTVYFGMDGGLHAATPDGTVKWSFVGADQPAIGADRTLYARGGGYLYAIGPLRGPIPRR